MKKLFFVLLLVSLLMTACVSGEVPNTAPPEAEALQVAAAEQLSEQARSAANLNGPSVEAKQVAERIVRTNLPGHIGFIYLVSPYTGDIILKATFVGKPTSTSKRLDPPQSYQISDLFDCGEFNCVDYLEYEAVAADGTYGSSMPGIFWYTTDGQMMEVRGDAALIVVLERPYVFQDGKIDMTVDVRLQTDQVDSELESQALAVEQYITETPGWEVGDPIPVEVLKGE